jgi:hypothetical protein
MASSYLTRSSANSSGSGTTATISFWVRKNTEAPGDGGFFQAFTDGSNFCSVYANPTLKMRNYISGSYSSGDITCNRKLRDPAAWYHLQFVWDTTNNTAADRMRIYVNGVRETSFSSSTNPSSSYSFTPFVSGTIYVNRYNQNTTTADNNFSHFHYCDGYAYEPTSFGSTDTTTGEWKINTSPNVQYGSNGFFIFKDGSSTTDQSGNSKTFTTTGTLTNTEDCPSNNFCTLNFLDRSRKASNNLGDALENGNTTFNTSNAVKAQARGTIGVNSGKYYWEGKYNSGTAWAMGFCLEEFFADTTADFWDATSILAVAANGGSGTLYINGRASDSFNTGVSLSGGDIFGFALDIDNKGFYVHKNGTYITANSAVGDPTSGSSRTGSVLGELTTGGYQNYIPDNEFLFPFCSDSSTGASASMDMNFGNGFFGTTAISSEGTNASGIGKFEYDVPTGYTALSTKGLNE